MAACRDGAFPAGRLTLPISRRAVCIGLAAALPGCAVAAPGRSIATPFTLPDLPPGPLRALGGLELDRAALGFGGLSGLYLSPDLTLTAISDLARFAECTLVLDGALRPRTLALRRTGRLGDGAGRPLARGFAGDAEALARLPDGRWIVAFERWHRIRAYRDLAGVAAYVDAPPGLERAPYNAGLEALTILDDGRWLAITENLRTPDQPDVVAGWIGRPGAWRPIGYRPGQDMLPVDAASLPDGGVLVLERGFTWLGGFTGRLCHLPAAALGAPVLAGAPILEIAPPLPADNYEGVAIARHAGRTLVALVSDDNDSGLQRSLLLLFEWGA